MAFDPTPVSFISTYNSDGTTVSFNIATIDGFTVAEAEPLTGDWRAIMMRLLEHTYNYVQSLDDADKPVKLTSRRVRNEVTGKIRNTYTIEVDTDINEFGVTSE